MADSLSGRGKRTKAPSAATIQDTMLPILIQSATTIRL